MENHKGKISIISLDSLNKEIKGLSPFYTRNPNIELKHMIFTSGENLLLFNKKGKYVGCYANNEYERKGVYKDNEVKEEDFQFALLYDKYIFRGHQRESLKSIIINSNVDKEKAYEVAIKEL